MIDRNDIYCSSTEVCLLVGSFPLELKTLWLKYVLAFDYNL